MDILKRKKKNRKPSLTGPPTAYEPKPPLPARQHHQIQPQHQLQQSHPAYHQHQHPQHQYPPHQYQHHQSHPHQQHQQHASPTLPPRPSQLTLYSPHETPLSSHFDSVMTQIDCESLSGDEDSLFSYPQNHTVPVPRSVPFGNISSVMAGTYFSKVDQYSNSQLPHHHPPFTESFESWATICLAAQYSLRVYTPTTENEETSRILSPWHHTSSTPKATCIKSVSMDSARVIVFAIRGTASFSDWATNLQTAPASSADFLSDAESTNYCHAGFLAAARSMIGPVSARIRALLQADPGRASYSLLMTGHSAGGAIASLLYAHMVSGDDAVESDLSTLAGWFRRVHCITFGAPPVSLLPLRKPSGKRWRKSLFLAFANQGDPVVRAEKAYVKSLLELLAAPPPKSLTTWDVPQSTLSNAGDVVVLRPRNPKAPSDRKTVQERLDEGVDAVTCGQEDLRPLVWGDPVCHLMKLYKDRIDMLAVQAVTAER